jgi:hypothetical protein
VFRRSQETDNQASNSLSSWRRNGRNSTVNQNDMMRLESQSVVSKEKQFLVSGAAAGVARVTPFPAGGEICSNRILARGAQG